MADIDVVVVGYRPGKETARVLGDVGSLTVRPHALHYFDNTGNPKNLSAAWNDLAFAGSAPYIAILNSDVALCPSWDVLLSGVLDMRADVGAAIPAGLGPGVSDFHGRSVTLGDPPETAELAEVAAWAAAAIPGHLVDYGPECAPFFAVMVRRAQFEGLRGFDERLRFYGQDHDFQDRLRALGLKVVRVDYCPLWHGGSLATRSASAHRDLSVNDEYQACGRVLAPLRDGKLARWHALGDGERASVRSDPAYRIGSGR